MEQTNATLRGVQVANGTPSSIGMINFDTPLSYEKSITTVEDVDMTPIKRKSLAMSATEEGGKRMRKESPFSFNASSQLSFHWNAMHCNKVFIIKIS